MQHVFLMNNFLSLLLKCSTLTVSFCCSYCVLRTFIAIASVLDVCCLSQRDVGITYLFLFLPPVFVSNLLTNV